MNWRIEFHPAALKEFEALDKGVQRQILAYLRNRLATRQDPRRFGKPLRGESAGLWRYRVEDYRLICEIRAQVLVVFILRVAHRRHVYD